MIHPVIHLLTDTLVCPYKPISPSRLPKTIKNYFPACNRLIWPCFSEDNFF